MVFALEQVVFLKSFDKKKSPAGGLFSFRKSFLADLEGNDVGMVDF